MLTSRTRARHSRTRSAALAAEQQAARQAVAGMPLDTIFVNPRWGEMSLRWALIHMIGEYAGHTGQESPG